MVAYHRRRYQCSASSRRLVRAWSIKLIIVDTSGSVSSRVLKAFLTESAVLVDRASQAY